MMKFISTASSINMNKINEKIKINLNSLYQNKTYNNSQLKIFDHFNKNKLTMILGPPGTGKTTTAIGIIDELLQSNLKSYDKLKIFVNAFSNAAIDNVLIRMHYNKSSYLTRCIRLGNPNKIKYDELKYYHID